MAKRKNLFSSLSYFGNTVLTEMSTVSDKPVGNVIFGGALPIINKAVKKVSSKAEDILPNVGKSIKIYPEESNNLQKAIALPKILTLPKTLMDKGCSVKSDPWVKKCAILADLAYGKGRCKIPRDCSFITGLADDESGTKARIYSIGGGKTIVCAFPGSGLNGKDWVTNLITQPLGISGQYKKALEFANHIVDVHGCKVMFVGHSKGGGMAAYCAASLGLKAVIFNPAKLGDMTKLGINRPACRQAEIDAYVFWNDLVNIGQEAASYALNPLGVGLPGRYETHIVTDYFPEDISIGEWHGMEGILRYFGIKV